MKIIVRLLISIDRGRGIDDAWDTLNLVKTSLDNVSYPQLMGQVNHNLCFTEICIFQV